MHNLSSIVKIVLLIMLRTNVCQNGFDVRKCCLHEMPKDLALVKVSCPSQEGGAWWGGEGGGEMAMKDVRQGGLMSCAWPR